MALANREVVVHIVITDEEARYIKMLLKARPSAYENIADEPQEEYTARINIYNALTDAGVQ